MDKKYIVIVRKISTAWKRVYFFIPNLLYDRYRPEATYIEVPRNWNYIILSNITIKKVTITKFHRQLGEEPMQSSLGQFLDEVADTYKNKPALMFKPGFKYVSWTYKRLAEDSRKAAVLLRQQGLEQGDVAVIWGPNSPVWVISFFACMRAGIIAVPLDMRSSQEFVDTVVAKTRPKLAIVSQATPKEHESMGIPLIYMEDMPLAFDSLNPVEDTPVETDDVAEIMFTSGTTGDPKGVMLTHKNLLSNLESVGQIMTGRKDDRLLSILPLSHMFEQMGGLLFPLRIGADVTYITSRRPKAIFKAMQERRVTVMLLVPQALDLFKKGIEREIERQGRTTIFNRLVRLSRKSPKIIRKLMFRSLRKQMGGRLRMIIAGGAPLSEPVGQWWTLLGVDVVQGYGATEASPIIACHPESAPRFDCPGPPAPGIEIRIDESGEVLVRGDNITPGYWEDEKKTSEVFEGEWYKTGDQGLLDDNGFLRLNGRKKDMIVLPNGQNVFPEDIEQVLENHLNVVDAVVVGIDREESPEVHAALILERPEEAADVVRWANNRLASHQRIRNHTIWQGEDFPRTHTLKVKKPLVIEAILSGGLRESKYTSSNQEENAVLPLLRLAAELTGIPVDQLRPDIELEAGLGLDSLGRVELLSAIEEDLDIYVDDGDILPETTLRDLQLLVDRGEKSDDSQGYKNWGLHLWARIIRIIFLNAFILPLIKISYRIDVEGKENLNNLEGPSLLIANHVLHMDNAIYVKALPDPLRSRLAIAAGAHMYNSLIKGTFITLIGNAFPFATGKSEKEHRKGNIRSSLENMGEIMDNGWSVLIYPEGELTVGGPTKPFLNGTGLMAIAGNLPVVPIRINIEGIGKPTSIPFIKRGHVTVRFGTPIMPPWESDSEKVTQLMEKSVAKLAS